MGAPTMPQQPPDRHLNLNDPADKATLHQMLAQDTAFAGLRRTLFHLAQAAQDRTQQSA